MRDLPRRASSRGSTRASVVDRVDNGLDIDNEVQGEPICVCRGQQVPWSRIWARAPLASPSSAERHELLGLDGQQVVEARAQLGRRPLSMARLTSSCGSSCWSYHSCSWSSNAGVGAVEHRRGHAGEVVVRAGRRRRRSSGRTCGARRRSRGSPSGWRGCSTCARWRARTARGRAPSRVGSATSGREVDALEARDRARRPPTPQIVRARSTCDDSDSLRVPGDRGRCRRPASRSTAPA